jgi:hypothetical protein
MAPLNRLYSWVMFANRHLCLLGVLALVTLGTPYRAIGQSTPTPFSARTTLDHLFLRELRTQGIQPAHLCSDAVFLRRAYLDLTGTLPPAKRAENFIQDPSPTKRADLVTALMQQDAFVDYWTLKWCDLLRVKAEFPINLWPNGVQAYARWIHDAVAQNMSYDTFARTLLTSSGSNFREPAVNFYRAVQGDEPATLASAVALTFMGTRLNHWPTEQRTQFETIFSQMAFKGTAEWKETIVYHDPAPHAPLAITFPDGLALTVPAGQDPRSVFANWLLSPGNPWFARNIANRTWSWFFGQGLIHEADDIRPDNPPVHPKVLKYLETELVNSGYDLRHLFSIILNSNTYQQQSQPRASLPDATRWFARYPLRRLDAEVLLDALCDFSGHHDTYSSQIPEPFTFIPTKNRNIALTDGSITSPFLKMFGRPGRDTGLESERTRGITKDQRLHLINSSHVFNKINRSEKAFHSSKRPDHALNQLYLTILSRYPTEKERAVAAAYMKTARGRSGKQDLLWALVNSKEFLYQH